MFIFVCNFVYFIYFYFDHVGCYYGFFFHFSQSLADQFKSGSPPTAPSSYVISGSEVVSVTGMAAPCSSVFFFSVYFQCICVVVFVRSFELLPAAALFSPCSLLVSKTLVYLRKFI